MTSAASAPIDIAASVISSVSSSFAEPVPGRNGTRSADFLGNDLHRRDPLGHRLRARLAGRTAERDPVRAGCELPAHQRPQAVVIHVAVGGERGDDRSDRAADRGRIGSELHGAGSTMVRSSDISLPMCCRSERAVFMR